YFFAYPDDYAETYIGHADNGEFVRRAQKRTFEVIFVYNSADGVVDLFAQADRRTKVELLRIFCKVILGEDTAGRCDGPTYELDHLLSRDFPLDTDPADGVEEVRVRKLRLSLSGGGRRITLEADHRGRPEDVYDMVDEYLTEKCLSHADARVSHV